MSRMSREEFMEYWRSDESSEELTVDDRMEIFTEAPVGASDITKEVLDNILVDYCITNLEIIDTSTIEPPEHLCHHGGDIRNDCSGCALSNDYRYDPKEHDCVERDIVLPDIIQKETK